MLSVEGSLLTQSDDSCFYFLHIPKTAGTSFTVILDRFFDVSNIFETQLWWHVGDVSKVREQEYSLIRGHFGMAAKLLSAKPLKMLTFLRNPVEMAYSTYEYVKRDVNTKLHKYVVENELSFEEFLKDRRTKHLTKNRMVKALTFGDTVCDSDAAAVIDAENYKEYRKKWNAHRRTLSGQQLLQQAKNNLKNMHWFGLVEQFELSIQLLCFKNQWPDFGETEKLNANMGSKKISDQSIQLVHDLNNLDIEFYQYAKNLFEMNVQSMLSELGAGLNKKLSLSTAIDLNYQNSPPGKCGHLVGSEVNYEFGSVLIGKNWHRRELLSETQRFFRWTGPVNKTEIYFWLKPNAYRIELEYINFISKEVLDSIVFNINGNSVECHNYKNTNNNGGFFQIVCEQDFIKKNGLMVIEFQTEKLRSHSDVFNSSDHRQVGIAFCNIRVKREEIDL